MEDRKKGGMKVFQSSLLVLDTGADHLELVKKFIDQTLNIKTTSNPDLLILNQEQESIKIKTVRELIQKSAFTSYQSQLKVVVLLHADLATTPSQNALLKIVEEPPTDTFFILTTSRPEKLLPTLRSRCQEISFQTSSTDKQTSLESEIIQFLDDPSFFSYGDLVSVAEKYKDRTMASDLITEIIKYFAQKKSKMGGEIKSCTIATNSLNLLERNINTRLVLENCLFKIKQFLELDNRTLNLANSDT